MFNRFPHFIHLAMVLILVPSAAFATTVNVLTGNVLVSPAGGDYKSAQGSFAVGAGDKILLKSGASAVVTCPNGAELTLGAAGTYSDTEICNGANAGLTPEIAAALGLAGAGAIAVFALSGDDDDKAASP